MKKMYIKRAFNITKYESTTLVNAVTILSGVGTTYKKYSYTDINF